MKKIWLFLYLILLASCNPEIQFDGGTRNSVQGKLVDSGNNPVAGQTIYIEVYNDYTSDIIAKGVSESNGNFTLIYPKPSTLNILTKIVIPENNTFNAKEIFNIKDSNFSLYNFNANSIKLSKSSEIIELIIKTQSSFQGNFIDNLVLTGNMYEKEQDFSPLTNLQYNNYDFGKQFLLFKNQTINIKYRKINVSTNPAIITNVNENIIIGNTNQILTIIN